VYHPAQLWASSERNGMTNVTSLTEAFKFKYVNDARYLCIPSCLSVKAYGAFSVPATEFGMMCKLFTCPNMNRRGTRQRSESSGRMLFLTDNSDRLIPTCSLVFILRLSKRINLDANDTMRQYTSLGSVLRL
jgi:hypothetical protein